MSMLLISLDVNYSDEGNAYMMRKENNLILVNTQNIAMSDSAPPQYILAKKGRIVLHNWFSN
jgi:hypothetical protein